MKKIILNSTVCILFISPSICLSDQETDKAIGEVQEMMKTPGFAEKAANNSPEAPAAAKYVKDISGNVQNEQEIYKLAAEVFGNMKGMSPEQMKEFLDKAKNDPSAFAKTWTPEQIKKLKELSERLPASNQTNP